MSLNLKKLPQAKVNAILQIAELFQNEDKSSSSDRNTEILTEILHYVKGIHEMLSNSSRNDEETLLQPKKFGNKRKATEPLTANKIKKSLVDLEESYQQEEDDGEEPQFESVEYPSTDTLLLEAEDVKPFARLAKNSREFEFPLNEPEQVNALEEEIGRPNSHIRKQLIETIHTIQGNIKDHRVTIRTFLRVMFTDHLLVQYTWKGYENKQALCGYKNLITFLKKILIRWFPDDDLSDFVKVIQNYIKNVPSRLKNFKKDEDN